MKLIDVFSKRNSIKPANVAMIAAVGILMTMLAIVIFRVS